MVKKLGIAFIVFFFTVMCFTQTALGAEDPIAVTKVIEDIKDIGNGWYRVTFRIDVTNTGDEELVDIEVIDWLVKYFELAEDWRLAAENPLETGGQGGFAAADAFNENFDGANAMQYRNNNQLLDPDKWINLGVGEKGFIRLTIEVLPGETSKYTNEVGASAAAVNEKFAQVTINFATPQAIPTLSEWGMIIFSLLLAGSAIWMIRRRQVS